MSFTLPPGRLAAFGDAKCQAPLATAWVAAVARAAQDPVLQWYCQTYSKANAGHPDCLLELLSYDRHLKPEEPTGKRPLAVTYPAHSALFCSRSSWASAAPTCIVYGKGGHGRE